MTLYDTATELRVRLEAASEADAGDELLTRGKGVRDQLAAAVRHLDAVKQYREDMGRSDRPAIDVKRLRQAIGGFRGALSKSGPRAFQQQTAATLLDAVENEIKKIDRWVTSTWRDQFVRAQASLARVESGELHGSITLRTTAKSRAAAISALRNADPIRGLADLEHRLEVSGIRACVERIGQLIGELEKAIADIDGEHQAMSPEVRQLLNRAASSGGLPLSDITPQQLAALHAAGVIDDLVVRKS
jgi:hypothetical protein